MSSSRARRVAAHRSAIQGLGKRALCLSSSFSIQFTVPNTFKSCDSRPCSEAYMSLLVPRKSGELMPTHFLRSWARKFLAPGERKGSTRATHRRQPGKSHARRATQARRTSAPQLYIAIAPRRKIENHPGSESNPGPAEQPRPCRATWLG